MRVIVSLLLFILLITSPACRKQDTSSYRTVTVYTSVDQVYAEPILKEFQQRTGITVNAKFDVEAVKTVGLANALIAEKDHPRCDVFWNNEIMHTIVLKKMGLLAPYISPSAAEIPGKFRDRDGFWTGIAARARVIIYNKDVVNSGEVPRSIQEFLNPKWRGKAGIGLPMFGTTATQAAALFTLWGEDRGRDFFRQLKENKTAIVAGNAQVKDLVSSGELAFGLTDTDDAHIALLSGSPVEIVFPDQDSVGTLIIPNSIAMVKGCPHPEEARMLIDYILGGEVEEKLAWGRSAHMPLRAGIRMPPRLRAIDEIVSMRIDYEKMAEMYPRSSEEMKRIFLK